MSSMTAGEEEEVVKLLFGDTPPENWRENQEFLLYLQELGNLGADRLTVEPDRVREELSAVQMSTQELAFSNYKTFIQTSDCSRQIYNEFSNTEKHLENLVDKMPGFLEKCEEFKQTANEISTHRKLTSLTLSKHTTLLEILELPQLMDTVVRNQHYDEALELHAYVTKLSKKQPEVKILTDISRNVTNSVKLMLQQLLAQLRAPIQLPQCLKVVSYLRRMDIFDEAELRLKFLQARETWLQSVTNTVPRDDPYKHITSTMDVMRVHLFDIVTQYRAIFSDETVLLDQAPVDNRLLFSSWLSRKVEEFLTTLLTDLEHDLGSVESLLGQAMYFGLSFSKVGYDFRPMLAPIFEKTVIKQFNKIISFEGNQKVLSDSFIGLNLVKAGGLNCSFALQDDVSQPPLLLIEFPPLAHACNIVLAALNHIRLCAPVSLVWEVTNSLNQLLINVSNMLVNFHRNHNKTWRDTEVLGFQNLCRVYRSLLLPYLQRALSAVFPPGFLTDLCGYSTADLASKQLGFLDQDEVLKPVLEFIPPEPVLEPIPAAPAADDTEYVADKLAELVVAVEHQDSDDALRENGVNDCTPLQQTDQSGGDNASQAGQSEESQQPNVQLQESDISPGQLQSNADDIQSEGANDSISQSECGNSQDLDSRK